MSERKAYFMGLLTNVDSSILDLKLDHGFKIQEISTSEGKNRISDLERIPALQALFKISHEYPCLNDDENKIYFISNSFILTFERDEEENTQRYGHSLTVLQMLVHDYLDELLRKMRLFKEGDIRLPLKYYYYFMEDNNPFTFIIHSSHRYVSREQCHIQEDKMPELIQFFLDTKLPFMHPYMNLAFENFELSYETPFHVLSFLALMVSMEVLFNPGEHELRYRISRNTAVLLGADEEDSKRIYDEMRRLYDLRSKIVHRGITDELTEGDVYKLRSYVRASINKINRINLRKNELLQNLNMFGFGDSPRLE